jgi:hypothetical protein
VSATPPVKDGKAPEKPDLDAPIGDIGDQSKITSPGDLKEKSKKLVEDAEKENTPQEKTPTPSGDDIAPKPQESATYNTGAEFRTQPTWPDPDRSAAAIASQSASAPANDNEPQPREPAVATQSQPASERPAAGGMPDPDPPARAIATQPPPANDNNPRSPANDNDPSL